MSINKDMTIEEILHVDVGIADLLMEAGMHCLGCIMAHGETLEQACAVHGIDCDALVDTINQFLAKNAHPPNRQIGRGRLSVPFHYSFYQ